MKQRKAILLASSIASAAFILTGCGISSPTYGTDKSSTKQLFDDISSMASLKAINKNSQVDIRPRPELVRINPDEITSLPVPQENVANSTTQDWPESPEQLRKRLRDEATANQGNPNYVSPITSGNTSTNANTNKSLKDRDKTWLDGIHREGVAPSNSKQQRAEYQRLKAEQQAATQGGNSATRKYLSEPPLDYRQPATTAPAGQRGEDEAKKERERKKNSATESGKKSWWPF